MFAIMHSQIWFWLVWSPIVLALIILIISKLATWISKLKVLYMFHVKKKVLAWKYQDDYSGNSILGGLIHDIFSNKIWYYRDRTENDNKPIYKK